LATELQVSPAQLERQNFHARASRRSIVISLASTLAFVLIAYFALVSTPGWNRVSETFFNFKLSADVWPAVLDGLWLNLRVLGYTVVSVTVFASLIAFARTLRNPVFFPLRAIARGYVDFFRGIPLIIVLYLVGFGLPGLRIESLGRIPVELLGTIALTLTYSAYVAEVFRAGIESVHVSQRLAARSLGLTYSQSMRLVVLPQALRKVVPPLMNDLVSLQKDVGLISVLGAVDAVRAAQIEVAHYANFTPYVIAGLLFVLMALPTLYITDRFTERLRSREQAGTVL
jgi:polar amino acid transport system permease protein